MFSLILHVSFLLVFVARNVLAADLKLFTPEVIQCQTTTITWNGGAPKYLLSVVPANDPCSDSVVHFDQTSKTSMDWKVTVLSGSALEFMVEDSLGDESWSGIVTVKPSNDTSCIDPAAAKAISAAGSGPAFNGTSHTSSGVAESTNGLYTPSIPASAYPSIAPVVPVGAGNVGSSPPNSGVRHAPLSVGFVIGSATVLLALYHL